MPKINDCRSKSMTCDDFRGIAISSILSKVFERSILERFESYFSTSDNQFGFKKELSCSHAIFTVNKIVGHFISGGSTANICAIDLSKAFDKVDHHVLLMKLMKRHLPNELLDTLDYCMLNTCCTCAKWFDAFSDFFKINIGVRQGSVLSPFLFAVYHIIDDMKNLHSCGVYSLIIFVC